MSLSDREMADPQISQYDGHAWVRLGEWQKAQAEIDQLRRQLVLQELDSVQTRAERRVLQASANMPETQLRAAIQEFEEIPEDERTVHLALAVEYCRAELALRMQTQPSGKEKKAKVSAPPAAPEPSAEHLPGRSIMQRVAQAEQRAETAEAARDDLRTARERLDQDWKRRHSAWLSEQQSEIQAHAKTRAALAASEARVKELEDRRTC